MSARVSLLGGSASKFVPRVYSYHLAVFHMLLGRLKSRIMSIY